jgi:hypothetical protein
MVHDIDINWTMKKKKIPAAAHADETLDIGTLKKYSLIYKEVGR